MPFCKRPSASTKGFTLLELLVAIVVFSTMAVMAYGGLQNVIDNSQGSRAAVERLKQVQITVTTLSRDLMQIYERDIINAFGVTEPYLVSDTQSEQLVEFTRSGRRNPAGLPRSSLQRVAYRLDDNKLYRLHWIQIDQALGEEPIENELIADIDSMEFRFMDGDGEWSDSWPPLTATASGAPATLRAIEYSLELKDWGRINRLYEVRL